MKSHLNVLLFLFFPLFSLTGLTSCGEKKEEKKEKKSVEKKEEKGGDEEEVFKIDLKEEKVNDLYSIGLVSYLSKTEGINDLASLQVNNTDKDVYLLVIEDEKKEIKKDYSIAQYYDMVLGNITQVIQNAKVTEPRVRPINGLNSFSGRVTGKVGDANYVYLITIVESETYYYQIVGWTLSKNPEQIREIEFMIDSFKQL